MLIITIIGQGWQLVAMQQQSTVLRLSDSIFYT